MRTLLAILTLLYVASSYGQDHIKKVEQLLEVYIEKLHSEPDTALTYLTEATRISRKLDDKFLLSRCLYNQGHFYYLKNNLHDSKNYTLQSLVHAKTSANHKISALANNQLGLIAMDESKYHESFKRLILAVTISEKYGLKKNECLALNNLGLLFRLEKRHAEVTNILQAK